MDIRQLRYFIAIADEGSISAAAQRLGVAQPSLSQHMLRMEQELGVALLQRSPRGILVTPSGEILLRHARNISRWMQLCESEVRRSSSVAEGLLAVGLSPSVSMVLSVPLAETVRLELPKVRLRAVEAMSGYIHDWLIDETIDIGFLYDIHDKSLFDSLLLMREELHFFAPPDNWPLACKPGEPVRFSDVARLELILPSLPHGLRRTAETYAAMAGFSMKVVIEMDALSQIKELVARGSGFTILAPSAVQDRLVRGDLVGSPVVDPVMIRPVHLARKRARPPSFIGREVERITLDVVRDLVNRRIWPVHNNALLF